MDARVHQAASEKRGPITKLQTNYEAGLPTGYASRYVNQKEEPDHFRCNHHHAYTPKLPNQRLTTSHFLFYLVCLIHHAKPFSQEISYLRMANIARHLRHESW